jgi:RNase_H superfamily
MVKLYKAPVNGPKVLLLDLETAPIIAHVWGLWENNVGLNQIVSDWHLLSWSAKWLHAPSNETMYMDQRNAFNMEDDSRLLKMLWKLLDEADVIITQNGKKFDQPKFNARFILMNINGGHPPSTFKHIDTAASARKHFGFTSNKLEYMTDKLCIKYKKLKHKKFPGHEMWTECLKRNVEAWQEMEKYNKWDVLSLEELYLKLSPWMDNHPNFNLYSNNIVTACRCGNDSFKRNGFYYTSVGKFQRHKCLKCGAETRDRKNLFSKEKVASLKLNIPR